MAKGMIAAQRIPRIKNGQCQPRSAIHSPAGTPSADAKAKALITVPIAVARRISGMASPTMASTTPPQTPPKTPVMNRAASIAWYPGASAQQNVPTVKPVKSTSRARLRSKRSRKNAAEKLESPAPKA